MDGKADHERVFRLHLTCAEVWVPLTNGDERREAVALTLFNLPFSRFWWGNPAFKEWRIPLSDDPAVPRATNKLWDEPITSAAITLGYKDTDRWSPAFWDPPLRGTTPPPFPSAAAIAARYH